jgi:glutamyl-tRNA(Gln) amidotransferase subunit E
VGGALIEIKGVQELNLVSKVVEYEVQRQVKLLELAGELKRRGVKGADLEEELIDVSDAFKSTKSRIIRRALERGGRALALRLPSFSGIVGAELCLNRRLGTEMADHAKFRGGVGGLFHTDELPDYDVTDEEVQAMRTLTNAKERMP